MPAFEVEEEESTVVAKQSQRFKLKADIDEHEQIPNGKVVL